MAPTPFTTIAHALLDAAAAALGTSVPDRSFVSHNVPAWDGCDADQLTVNLQGVTFKQTKGPRHAMSVASPLWVVQIVRCAPNLDTQGVAPSPDRLEVSADDLLTDLDLIQQAVRSGAVAIFGAGAVVQYQQAVPLGPQGNVAGYSWPITAEVTGTA